MKKNIWIFFLCFLIFNCRNNSEFDLKIENKEINVNDKYIELSLKNNSNTDLLIYINSEKPGYFIDDSTSLYNEPNNVQFILFDSSGNQIHPEMGWSNPYIIIPEPDVSLSKKELDSINILNDSILNDYFSIKDSLQKKGKIIRIKKNQKTTFLVRNSLMDYKYNRQYFSIINFIPTDLKHGELQLKFVQDKEFTRNLLLLNKIQFKEDEIKDIELKSNKVPIKFESNTPSNNL